jgi:hypothetical protein
VPSRALLASAERGQIAGTRVLLTVVVFERPE